MVRGLLSRMRNRHQLVMMQPVLDCPWWEYGTKRLPKQRKRHRENSNLGSFPLCNWKILQIMITKLEEGKEGHLHNWLGGYERRGVCQETSPPSWPRQSNFLFFTTCLTKKIWKPEFRRKISTLYILPKAQLLVHFKPWPAWIGVTNLRTIQPHLHVLYSLTYYTIFL